MTALACYAAVAGLLVLLGGGVAASLLGGAAASGVWWAAGVAYGVQVAAFALLILVRRRQIAVLAVWGGGMLARLALVVGVGVWLGRSGAYPPAPLLVSLAGFLFLLLLLEPVFFRMGMHSR